MKIRPVGTALIREDSGTDRTGTDLTKVTGVCRDYAKATDDTAVRNKYVQLTVRGPIPVAARYKAWVCGRSLAGIAGSNPAEGHGYLSLANLVCCIGDGFCDGPIPRPEEFCRVWCVSERDQAQL